VTGDALTAVVLNWRTHEMTLRACRALLDDGVPAERLVVVDNGSGDGSPERLRAALPGSIVVPLDENVGFARANNRAVLELPARHAYLLVNSDAFVHAAGSVARLLDELQDPSVGAAVPRLRNPDGSLQESVYPLSTPLPELVRAAGLSRIVPEPLAPRLAAHWDHGRTRDGPWGPCCSSARWRGTSSAASTSVASCTPRISICSGAFTTSAGARGSSPTPSSCTSVAPPPPSAGTSPAALAASPPPRPRCSGPTSGRCATA
jgi:hypothetical protein